MFPVARTDRSLYFSFAKLFALALGLCVVLISNVQAQGSVSTFKSDEGLRLELPANGNLRVENLRGGVIADLWNENYVSVLAITDNGQPSRSPAVVHRTDTLLSVRLPRGPINAPRINLEFKIPVRAHLAIV